MGFSLVAAAAIIGVSILMALEIIVGTTIPTITDLHDSYEDMKNRAIEQVQTDINITNAVWADPNMIISVDNTGSETINTSYCNILRNGESKTFTCSVSYLHPEQTALYAVAERFNPGDMIKIITPNGVSDYYTV
jgi:archaellum component FlaF (FlaF/FlaG flagellin family)